MLFIANRISESFTYIPIIDKNIQLAIFKLDLFKHYCYLIILTGVQILSTKGIYLNKLYLK